MIRPQKAYLCPCSNEGVFGYSDKRINAFNSPCVSVSCKSCCKLTSFLEKEVIILSQLVVEKDFCIIFFPWKILYLCKVRQFVLMVSVWSRTRDGWHLITGGDREVETNTSIPFFQELLRVYLWIPSTTRYNLPLTHFRQLWLFHSAKLNLNRRKIEGSPLAPYIGLLKRIGLFDLKAL